MTRYFSLLSITLIFSIFSCADGSDDSDGTQQDNDMGTDDMGTQNTAGSDIDESGGSDDTTDDSDSNDMSGSDNGMAGDQTAAPEYIEQESFCQYMLQCPTGQTAFGTFEDCLTLVEADITNGAYSEAEMETCGDCLSAVAQSNCNDFAQNQACDSACAAWRGESS